MSASPLVTEPGVESSATRQTCITGHVSLEFWICAASWGLYSEAGSGINVRTQFGLLEDASSMDWTSRKYCTVRDGNKYTGLFISPSGISELDCATTKTDTAERSISIGKESLQVFFVLGALAYFQVPPLGGSREEKWRSQ